MVSGPVPPACSADEEAELVRAVRSSGWLMEVLRAARTVDLPDWWIGGGVLRNLIWDGQHGGFDPRGVRDVDLTYYDAADLDPARDEAAEQALAAIAPHVRWDAKNQAAVHLWYPRVFGYAVPPLRSMAEAVATWPETATAVAVRLTDDDRIAVCAPLGLRDLLTGIWRRNPRRVSLAESRARLERQQVGRRWPKVRIVEP
jgi:hypothetical protein